jgi:hypothetical protein
METKENNKLIAEFMGLDEIGRYVPENLLPCKRYDLFQGIFEIEETEFHESWDWLMPVVEKIEEIRVKELEEEIISYHRFRVDMNITQCEITEFITDKVIAFGDAGSKLKSTYYAIGEFLRWYTPQEQEKSISY